MRKLGRVCKSQTDHLISLYQGLLFLTVLTYAFYLNNPEKGPDLLR